MCSSDLIDVNGNITGPGQWVTVRTATSSRQKLLDGNLVFHATTTKSVTLSFRLTDDAGNVKEYRVTYKLNTPPYIYLTSEKNNGRYNPLKNTGEFTAAAYSPYGVSKVYLKLNNGNWLLMKHITTNNWGLNNPSLLFKPNAWNTVTLHAVGDNGKSTTETTKFYYSESISWNFNTPSNRTGWSNYHLASTKNNVYLEGKSVNPALGYPINKGIVIKIGTKTNNFGVTNKKWKLYSFNLTSGIYNVKFYDVAEFNQYNGWLVTLKEIGEVKLGISQPDADVLKFEGKTGTFRNNYYAWWGWYYTAYGAIDNVTLQ